MARGVVLGLLGFVLGVVAGVAVGAWMRHRRRLAWRDSSVRHH